MYTVLKQSHLTLVLLAVVLFVVLFYWMKTDHINAQKSIFKKILKHTHLTILLLGALLMWQMQVNPFSETSFWVLEKIGAFGAYIMMVSIALNSDKSKGMQTLAFLGAFGWLAYIGKLAISKQAILLIG